MKKIIILLSLTFSFSSLGEIRVKIERNGVITNQAEFETKEKADKWLDQEISNGSFGKPAHKKCKEKLSLQDTEECEDVASEFKVIQEDITTELEVKRASEMAKKVAKEDRKKKLKEIDWSKVTTIAHVKDLLKDVLKELEE